MVVRVKRRNETHLEQLQKETRRQGRKADDGDISEFENNYKYGTFVPT